MERETGCGELARMHALKATTLLTESRSTSDTHEAHVHATLAVAYATLAIADVHNETLVLARETTEKAKGFAAESRALVEDPTH